jgi:ATP-binding cassette, subfamily B, bacterial
MTLPLDRYRNLLSTYLRPQGVRVLLLIVLLLASIGLQLANPQLLAYFIDTAITGGGIQVLIYIAVAFLGVAIAGQLVAVGETYVSENVGLTATNKLRSDLMLHCLRLDPAFHAAHTPGELIGRVDGDVGILSNFFSRFVVALLGNALLLVGVLLMLFLVDWRVGAALTLFVLVAIVAINRTRNIGAPYWEKAMQSEAELFGFLEERLSGTEDIRSSGATTYMMHGLHQHSRTVLTRFRKAAQMGLTTWATSIFLFTIGTAVALVLGVSLYRAGTITIGTVYLVFSYTTLLNRPMEQIVRQIQDLQQATASITRVSNILDIKSSIVDGKGAAVPAGALAVEFQGVSFSYVDDVPVLKNVALSLQPGTVMGLLGRTGSGKTTLTRLLVRLYDVTEGAVRLGGVDVRNMRLDDLRRRVGMVTQDIQLFHATVRNNLTLFDHNIPDERVIQVLEDLGLGAWYDSLPRGLDTKLAPGGGGLSAGEAQLLAFARVFLKDPGLVILDEASSRLDLATERRLERAIDKLLEGRSGIIIAHRLATVQRADSILILDDGACCEYGPRDVLAAHPTSRFAQLLRTGMEEVLA